MKRIVTGVVKCLDSSSEFTKGRFYLIDRQKYGKGNNGTWYSNPLTSKNQFDKTSLSFDEYVALMDF